jgi:hypothetical protein
MNGGIQKGTTAYDSHSRTLNQQLTLAKRELAEELIGRGYTMLPRLAASKVPGGFEGMAPDGGIWYDRSGKIVAVFEGKKQGSKGNAHERWYKNNAIISHLNPLAKYVTFCCGAGVLRESTMYKCFGFALARERKKPCSWNKLHSTGVSFFGSEHGFTVEQLKTIMRESITGEKE